MKRCRHIPQDHYWEVQGVRKGCSPMAHYPDLCPHYDAAAVGDCWNTCFTLGFKDRPCCKAAHTVFKELAHA